MTILEALFDCCKSRDEAVSAPNLRPPSPK